MTTNVPKGANRASAAKKSAKHAQRTPLPPKPEKVADAKAVLEAAEALAGWVAHNAETDRAEAAEMAVEAPSVATWGKAKAFAEKAGAAKWEASTEAVGTAVEVTVTRGSETVVQAWAGGVWSYEASVYAYGDRTTKPRNASGALKLLLRSPEDAKAEMAKVASNRHFRKAEPKDIVATLEVAQTRLPFDPALATDEEVLTVLRGQAVTWYNRISRKTESAIVGRGRHMRISLTDDNQRVVNMCCPVTGFRSFLVTAILQVGRGRIESAAAETQKVLVDAR